MSELYAVLILRTDGNHIEVLQTPQFKVALEKWSELNDQWIKASTEKISFILKEPIISAFVPQLIYEITIRPVDLDSPVRMNNPYAAKAGREGFSSVFPNSQGNF